VGASNRSVHWTLTKARRFESRALAIMEADAVRMVLEAEGWIEEGGA
jgi:hypothetical protein